MSRSDEAGLVQVALPSKPTHAPELDEVHRFAEVVASPPAPDHSSDLGRLATSHINGRAVWWVNQALSHY